MVEKVTLGKEAAPVASEEPKFRLLQPHYLKVDGDAKYRLYPTGAVVEGCPPSMAMEGANEAGEAAVAAHKATKKRRM